MQTIQINEQMSEYFLEFDVNIKDYKMKHFDEKIKQLKHIHENKGGVSNDAEKSK